MRFCMVTTFYPPHNFGGDGLFVYRLANQLAGLGHTVHVIHCADAYLSLAGKAPSGTYPNHPNVTVHSLHSPFGILSPLLTQQTGRPLLKTTAINQVLSQGFDVIHFHNPSLVGGPGVFGAGTAIKLYTMHEYWLVCPTHMLLKYNREPCVERSCLACTVAHKRPPQLWRYTNLLSRSLPHIDRFIAPSRFLQSLHERELGIPVVHIPNFVPDDAPENLPPTPATTTAPPYFLFVGRLEHLKGAQTLLPLFRRYRKAQLWIAGTGNYEPALRELAHDCDNVRFLGFQTEDGLRTLYRDAVGVIVPSLYYENFPLVTLEAFKHRTPIVVRNIGGLPEVVEDSGGGFVYDDETQLEAAVDALASNRELRTAMGASGRQAFEAHWTPAPHLERYFGLIEDLTRSRQA